MALYGRDANGNDAYIRGTGTGSTTDGYITFHDPFSSDAKFISGDFEAGATEVISAVTGEKHRVMSYQLCANGDCYVQFQSGTNTQKSGRIYLSPHNPSSHSDPLGVLETVSSDILQFTVTPVSFVATLVDATADTLTLKSHPFDVRDPVRISAATTMPTGLSATTTYYVIDDTADTIKLATSAKNASAGTAVDFTDVGVGDITITRFVTVGLTLSYRQV